MARKTKRRIKPEMDEVTLARKREYWRSKKREQRARNISATKKIGNENLRTRIAAVSCDPCMEIPKVREDPFINESILFRLKDSDASKSSFNSGLLGSEINVTLEPGQQKRSQNHILPHFQKTSTTLTVSAIRNIKHQVAGLSNGDAIMDESLYPSGPSVPNKFINLHPNSSSLKKNEDGKKAQSLTNAMQLPQKTKSMVVSDHHNQNATKNCQRPLISGQCHMFGEVSTKRRSCAFVSKHNSEMEEMAAKRREIWRIKKRLQRAKLAEKQAKDGDRNLRKGQTSCTGIRNANRAPRGNNYMSTKVLGSKSDCFFKTRKNMQWTKQNKATNIEIHQLNQQPLGNKVKDFTMAQQNVQGTKAACLSWTKDTLDLVGAVFPTQPPMGNPVNGFQTTQHHGKGIKPNNVPCRSNSLNSVKPAGLHKQPMDYNPSSHIAQKYIGTNLNPVSCTISNMKPVNGLCFDQQSIGTKVNGFQTKPNHVSCLRHQMDPVSALHPNQHILGTKVNGCQASLPHAQGPNSNHVSNMNKPMHYEDPTQVCQLKLNTRLNKLNNMQKQPNHALCSKNMESISATHPNKPCLGIKVNVFQTAPKHVQGPKPNAVSRTNQTMNSEVSTCISQDSLATPVISVNTILNHSQGTNPNFLSHAGDTACTVKPAYIDQQCLDTKRANFQTAQRCPNQLTSVSNANQTMYLGNSSSLNQYSSATKTAHPHLQGIKSNFVSFTNHSKNHVTIKRSLNTTFNRFHDTYSNNPQSVSQPCSSTTKPIPNNTKMPGLVHTLEIGKKLTKKRLQEVNSESLEEQHARKKEYWRTKKREQRARLKGRTMDRNTQKYHQDLNKSYGLQANKDDMLQSSPQTIECFTTKDSSMSASIFRNFPEASLVTMYNASHVKSNKRRHIEPKTALPLDPLGITKKSSAPCNVSRSHINASQHSMGKSKFAAGAVMANQTKVPTEEERIKRLRQYWRIKKQEQRASQAARIGNGLLRSKVLVLKQREQNKKSTQRQNIALSASMDKVTSTDPPAPIKEEHIYPTIQAVFSIPAITPCFSDNISGVGSEHPGAVGDPDSTLQAVASMKKLLEESLTTLFDSNATEVCVKSELEPVTLTTDDHLGSEDATANHTFQKHPFIKLEFFEDASLEDVKSHETFEDTSVNTAHTCKDEDPVAVEPWFGNTQTSNGVGVDLKQSGALQTFQMQQLGERDSLQRKREYWRIQKRQQRARTSKDAGLHNVSQQREYWRIMKRKQRARSATKEGGRPNVSEQREYWRIMKRKQRARISKDAGFQNVSQQREYWRNMKRQQRARRASKDAGLHNLSQQLDEAPPTDFKEDLSISPDEPPEVNLSVSEWRDLYLMDFDPVNPLLVCMVCGEQLYSVGVKEVKAHIQELHPRTLSLGNSEHCYILDAWDKQVAVREHFISHQLQQV
ncbi:hypothetical protein DNTS_001275 [Danionella cerebrum]|uniref:SPIN-DOC-like zinc-finger domain-containing protein n=1 Tax=Danionella cerebrum TaxID=2873325 RepID=A0A553MZW9_9TELE|nr:hypothetical protein DNTS_001275 [Danionella translucida]